MTIMALRERLAGRLLTLFGLLPAHSRARIVVLSLIRLALGGLDLVALFFIGLGGAIVSGNLDLGYELASYTIQAVILALGAQEAVIILFAGAAVLMLLRSLLVIINTKSLADEMARGQVGFSQRIYQRALLRGNGNASEVLTAAGSSTDHLFAGLFQATIMLTELLIVGAVVAYLFFVEPFLALVLLGSTAILSLLLILFMRRKLRTLGSTQIQASANHLRDAKDMLSLEAEIQVYESTDWWLRRVGNSRAEMAEASWRIQSLMVVPRYFIESSVIALGVLFAAIVALTADLLTEVDSILVFGLAGFRIVTALTPVVNAVNVLTASLARGSLALEALTDSSSPRHDPLIDQGEKTESVSISGDVTFRGTDGKPQSLQLSVDFGEVVTITGSSGIGKTSLLKELVFLSERPQSGLIFKSQDNASTKPIIGYCPQKPIVFVGTLEENLLCGREASESFRSEMVEILKGLGLSDLLDYLGGIHGFIDEQRQQSLSGGEKQRIVLARAILGHPNLLLLDEPTSALDESSAMQVAAYLNEKTNATSIVVTHTDHFSNVSSQQILLH